MRWHPSGTMLGSASNDKTVKLLEIKSEKIIYTETSSESGNINDFYFSSSFCKCETDGIKSVCFI